MHLFHRYKKTDSAVIEVEMGSVFRPNLYNEKAELVVETCKCGKGLRISRG